MPIWETIFFYIFAVGALLSSIGVVVFRNPLYSAIALIVDFFFFAGFYVLLSAHFMALIQVLVYGGAIMVLFMFIIMLLNLRDDEIERPSIHAHYALAVAVGIALFAFIGGATASLVDFDAIAQNRGVAAQAQHTMGEKALPAAIATESAVPGLYADLNETALEKKYAKKLNVVFAQEGSPADGKYRTVRNRPPFEVPPVLDPTQKRPPTFGTVQPLSVLLVNRFVVPFELIAVLLLAAIIGAVIIAKKRV